MANEEKLAKIRHSMAHVMAEAVLEIFPDAEIAIGPSIENGFYYDFELPRTLTEADLEDITERMKKIIKSDRKFVRSVVSRDEAKEIFKNQKYKLELLDAIPDGEDVSIYNQGAFTDLCRGPHVESTKELNAEAFKLLSIAGAYWRGDEKNQMLQRIYGTAWENPKDLRLYLDHLADIEKRDHRKLGKELDLFSLHEEAGPGLVYWHPRGARIRQIIEDCDASMVISIHQNTCALPSRRGSHVFFDKDSAGGRELALSIQSRMNALYGGECDNSALAGDYYMLKCTSEPSVIVECGFLSNAEDEKLLSDPQYIERVADAIFSGVIYYLA